MKVCDDDDCWRDAVTWTLVNFYAPSSGALSFTAIYSRCQRCGPPTFIGLFLLHDSCSLTLEEAIVWETMKS